ncbi:MAG TPA: oligosaccharide flippase family protein, partial [Blastocatellia bacterium]|nr:oligosaccharide flippase family protein [Blastocatellia bacterium]
MIQQSSVKAPQPETPPIDVARVAGRGTIYITAAKLWFMASGAVIYVVLPRLLTPEQFGLYQVVIGVASIVNAVVVTGTSQTVSKYISQEESKADSVKSKALKLQLPVGGGLALGFFLLAPVIASYLNDPRLANHLRLASLITLSYSFYSVFTGYFNGQKKFLTQAALDIAYSTLKLAFIVLFVWL